MLVRPGHVVAAYSTRALPARNRDRAPTSGRVAERAHTDTRQKQSRKPPMASPFGFPLRPGQRIFDQVGTDMLGVAIPGIRKISKGGPGVFSLADSLVGVGHGIDGGRKR